MFILSEFKNETDMVIKSLNGRKQSNTSDNVHHNNQKMWDMGKGWGLPHFPLSGQPDTNIGLAHPNNELE